MRFINFVGWFNGRNQCDFDNTNNDGRALIITKGLLFNQNRTLKLWNFDHN